MHLLHFLHIIYLFSLKSILLILCHLRLPLCKGLIGIMIKRLLLNRYRLLLKLQNILRSLLQDFIDLIGQIAVESINIFDLITEFCHEIFANDR